MWGNHCWQSMAVWYERQKLHQRNKPRSHCSSQPHPIPKPPTLLSLNKTNLLICGPWSSSPSLPICLPTASFWKLHTDTDHFHFILFCSFNLLWGFIICLGINTLTGILAPLHRFLLLGFGFLLKRQEGLKVWSFGLLINLLLTVCPLVTCVLEKDEAAIESSEFNATSVADVDKRVKRRLLMGNSFLPLSMCCYGACACIPDSTPIRALLLLLSN